MPRRRAPGPHGFAFRPSKGMEVAPEGAEAETHWPHGGDHGTSRERHRDGRLRPEGFHGPAGEFPLGRSEGRIRGTSRLAKGTVSGWRSGADWAWKWPDVPHRGDGEDVRHGRWSHGTRPEGQSQTMEAGSLRTPIQPGVGLRGFHAGAVQARRSVSIDGEGRSWKKSDFAGSAPSGTVPEALIFSKKLF